MPIGRMNTSIPMMTTNNFSSASPISAVLDPLAKAYGQKQQRDQVAAEKQAVIDAEQAKADITEEDRKNLNSLGLFGESNVGLLDDPANHPEFRANLVKRIDEKGIDKSAHSADMLQQFDAGNFDGIKRDLGTIIQGRQNMLKSQFGVEQGGGANQKAFQKGDMKQRLDTETDEIVNEVPVFNPNTQETIMQEVSRIPQSDVLVNKRNETAAQETARLKRESKTELGQFRTKEQLKVRISRGKEIKSELGDRNRQAARNSRKVNEALQLASNRDTSGGLMASAKLKLGKLFPDIDVSNEAALDSLLTSLATDQLQLFKGPTTDFEFGKTEAITGTITDPKKAISAKLNSLSRADWFRQKEFDQFNSFMKKGGDPDNFKFDFNEVFSKTKDGENITLQMLQDTAAANNLRIEDVINKLKKVK